ncbi:DUF1127 domain-containing protein [Chelativorans sp. EGI FJ00035]|uniref:DUF1127 domain-containing protein n=2 Tax=Chelativorans salis TaxID=2978478 RepID=A0ABT2LKR8_9HYPH|nr:DUF1127 domain-containing protein [Chelativorans sp. EGI FJ00035]
MGSIDTINVRSRSGTSNGAVTQRFARLLVKFVEGIELMLEKRRSRCALLELTDEQLKDIGISRADAAREGLRPFWD